MDKQKKQLSQELSKKTAFTLIELIIVITILAILATISFMSFKNYSGNTRDRNRLTTISQIKTGLEIYNVKTGEYPFPEENISTGMIQGEILAYKGEISDGISRKINISKTPKDPNYITQNYAYGITATKQEYQIGTLLENDISYVETPFISSAYADKIYYKAGVKGNYKGYIQFGTGGINYVVNIPSLLYNFSGSIDINGVNLQDENVYFITDKGENLPYTLGKEIETNKNTTHLIILSEDDIYDYVNNGTLPPNIIDENTLLSGFGIHDKKDFAYIINGEIPPSNEKANVGTGNVILSQSQVEQGDTLTISNNCSTPPTSYISSNDNIARIINNEIRTYTAGTVTIFPVGGLCKDNNGVPLTVNPSELWKQEDSNCKANDFVFTVDGVKYIWGGCNSTLGTSLTFENDNDNACRNYSLGQKNQLACDTLGPLDYYNSFGISSAKEFDTIWGQLYTWENASATNGGACPSGWHLSQEEEWEILETYLNQGVNCRNNQDSWQCAKLGWGGKQAQKTYNNVVKALQLPLSGSRSGFPTDGKLLYNARGERTIFWTSNSLNEYDSYYRYFHVNDNRISKLTAYNNFGFSARCVKNR
ncbi:MAG: FISUMP domain-containing protein [Candidatus Altimarinota bacterium]